MAMPSRPAQRTYRTWILDSRRWESYRPRRDDIVIATYPKSGTTWMQRIVSLLVFQKTEPLPRGAGAPPLPQDPSAVRRVPGL